MALQHRLFIVALILNTEHSREFLWILMTSEQPTDQMCYIALIWQISLGFNQLSSPSLSLSDTPVRPGSCTLRYFTWLYSKYLPRPRRNCKFPPDSCSSEVFSQCIFVLCVSGCARLYKIQWAKFKTKMKLRFKNKNWDKLDYPIWNFVLGYLLNPFVNVYVYMHLN